MNVPFFSNSHSVQDRLIIPFRDLLELPFSSFTAFLTKLKVNPSWCLLFLWGVVGGLKFRSAAHSSPQIHKLISFNGAAVS